MRKRSSSSTTSRKASASPKSSQAPEGDSKSRKAGSSSEGHSSNDHSHLDRQSLTRHGAKSDTKSNESVGAHLPTALQPGGPADVALGAAAENSHVNTQYLKEMRDGLDYIRRHPDLNSPPATESAEAMRTAYRTVLRKKKANRVLRYCLAVHAGIEVGKGMETSALDDFNKDIWGYEAVLNDFLPSNWRVRLENMRYASNKNLTASDDWRAFMRRLKSHRDEKTLGMMSGMNTLDEAIGGFRDVTLMAGRTGAGKTTLAMVLAAGVLRQQKDAGAIVFNLESHRDTYYTKLLSMESGIDYRTLKTKQWPKEVEDKVSAAGDRLGAEVFPRLRVVDWIDTEQGSRTQEVMRNTVKAFLEHTGVKKVFIIVDRLQKLEVEYPIIDWLDDNTPRRKHLSDMEADDVRMTLLRDLQKWTRKFVLGGFPVLGLSRVNKTEQGRRLTIDDVPGKSELVFEADSVLLLEPASHTASNPLVTATLLNIAKVRDGGEKGDIRMDFHHTVSRFVDRSLNAHAESATGMASKNSVAGQSKKRFRGKS